MQTDDRKSAWDFSPVYCLLHSLRPPQDAAVQTTRVATKSLASAPVIETLKLSSKGLGNFDSLWDYLGVEHRASSPCIPHFSLSSTSLARKDETYTSDGALYCAPSLRTSRLEDHTEDQSITDVQITKSEVPRLNKSQRKKRNRNLRKALDAQLKTHEFVPSISMDMNNYDIARHNTDSDSGPDPHHGTNHPGSRCVTSPQRASGRRRLEDASDGIAQSPQRLQEGPKEITHSIAQQRPIFPRYLKTNAADSMPVKAVSDWKTGRSDRHITSTLREKKLVVEPHTMEYPVIGLRTSKRLTIMSTDDTPPKSNLSRRDRLRPMHYQTQVDRNWSLFLKILHNFPNDRHYLVSPLQLSINRPHPDGIHVFVDASNILIGFHNRLKSSRGIPSDARVPRVDLNFHALALLLERRRPVAKRVLAGSAPEIPAFEEARQVGYETCILDKVCKVREKTERQKYFETKDKRFANNADIANGAIKSAKWVEQAVDEILHLKICESVLDTDTGNATATESGPVSHNRPTMVLATGDAAEAEYGPGFLRMVERALRRGWNVEIMAFGRSVSMGYRRLANLPMKSGGWGNRFKIIELDEYVEELFGEST